MQLAEYIILFTGHPLLHRIRYMRFLKSLLRGLASAGLKLGLIFLALTLALVMVFGTSAMFKQALRSSHIYDTPIDTIVNAQAKNKTIANQTTEGTIPESLIKQAAMVAFTPALLQSSSEQIIDGFYGWLRTNSAKPDFRVDLSDAKQRFTEAAANSAVERAQQLPSCTLQQIHELNGSTIDPFNVPCRPVGYDSSTLRAEAVMQIASNQDFLKDPVITADSFPKDSQGKSVFEKTTQAPRIFHWLLLMPWIMGSLTVLSILLLIILHDNKQHGLKSVAIALLAGGMVLLITTALSIYIFNRISQPGGQIGRQFTTGVQHSLLEVIRTLNNALNTRLLWFGGTYVVLGTMILLTLHFYRKLQIQPASPNSQISDIGITELPSPLEDVRK